jgi:hypothetical protein
MLSALATPITALLATRNWFAIMLIAIDMVLRRQTTVVLKLGSTRVTQSF